jgi:hypothetical protein
MVLHVERPHLYHWELDFQGIVNEGQHLCHTGLLLLLLVHLCAFIAISVLNPNTPQTPQNP